MAGCGLPHLRAGLLLQGDQNQQAGVAISQLTGYKRREKKRGSISNRQHSFGHDSGSGRVSLILAGGIISEPFKAFLTNANNAKWLNYLFASIFFGFSAKLATTKL